MFKDIEKMTERAKKGEEILAVIHKTGDVCFMGNRDECYTYMRTWRGWEDLRYTKLVDGKLTLWRMSSWVL